MRIITGSKNSACITSCNEIRKKKKNWKIERSWEGGLKIDKRRASRYRLYYGHVRSVDTVLSAAQEHVYTQNAFRCFRQSDSYWYLEEEHRRAINSRGDQRLRERLENRTEGGRETIGMGKKEDRGEWMSPIRVCGMHLHLKWLALARYSVAKSRDAWFLLFPSYSFASRIGSTALRYLAQATSGFPAFIGIQDSALAGRGGETRGEREGGPSVDRGFRLLSVANIPRIPRWCKFTRPLNVRALRSRDFQNFGTI